MKRDTKKTAERKQAFADLSRQIAAMDDIQSAQLAATMPVVTVAGHSLSAHNSRLITMQCHSATVVGGFRQWISAGRCVRKGERGMAILMPATRKDADTGEPGKTVFVRGYVWDVSQTDVLQADSSRENPAFDTAEPAAAEPAAAPQPAPVSGGYFSEEFTPL